MSDMHLVCEVMTQSCGVFQLLQKLLSLLCGKAGEQALFLQ